MRQKILEYTLVLGLVGVGGCGDDEPEPKVWGAPVRIDDAGAAGTRGDLAAVAIDATANAMAIWRQGDPGSDGQILFSRQTAGGAWSAPAAIGNAGARAGTGPLDVAMDGAGDAIAAWEINQPDPRSPTVGARAARYSAAGGWSESNFVNGLTAWFQPPSRPPVLTNVRVALDRSGHALIAYSGNYTQHNVVTFEPPDTIQNNGPGPIDEASSFSFEPVVAFDGSGTGIAVWSQFRPAEVVSRRVTAAGGWAELASVSGPMPDVQIMGDLDLAVNARGDAVAVWIQGTSGDLESLEYWASSAPAGGAWRTPVMLAQQGGYNAELASIASVAIDSGGNAIALLPSRGQGNMLYSRMTPAGNWSSPVPVGPALGPEPAVSDLAFGADGNALAVWLQLTGSGTRIAQAVFDGQTWTPPALLSVDSTSRAPRLAVAADGQAVATWAGDGAIWASRFE